MTVKREPLEQRHGLPTATSVCGSTSRKPRSRICSEIGRSGPTFSPAPEEEVQQRSLARSSDGSERPLGRRGYPNRVMLAMVELGENGLDGDALSLPEPDGC